MLIKENIITKDTHPAFHKLQVIYVVSVTIEKNYHILKQEDSHFRVGGEENISPKKMAYLYD